MNCHPIITAAVHHVWPLALRRIRRAIRRHAVHAAAAGLTIVCAAPPAIVLTLPPATVAEAPQGAPVDVPEPGTLWVMGVGLVGLGLMRGCPHAALGRSQHTWRLCGFQTSPASQAASLTPDRRGQREQPAGVLKASL